MRALHCRYCHGEVTLAEPASLAVTDPMAAKVYCDSCHCYLGTLKQALAFVSRKQDGTLIMAGSQTSPEPLT